MNPPPCIEVLGPWLKNTGDRLMLLAVADRLCPRADIAVSSTLGMDCLLREPQLLQVQWPFSRSGVAHAWRCKSPAMLNAWFRFGLAGVFRPDAAGLRQRGLTLGSSLAGLLDCSGFAYGDAWKTWRAMQRTAYYDRLRNYGIPIIALPQAYGPFDDPSRQDAYRRLFARFDRVYARDEISGRHVEALMPEMDVTVVPDITHLLPGIPPPAPAVWRQRVCIVPNARMLDRTAPRVSERYVALLREIIGIVRSLHFEPCLLLHEENDQALGHRIAGKLPFPIPLIYEDARITKGMVGASHAVIGSRYHALVSSLSQAVPALGTSWSHKYAALFDDYGCRDDVLDLTDDTLDLATRVNDLVAPARREARHQHLADRARLLRKQVVHMWEAVESRMIPGLGVRG